MEGLRQSLREISWLRNLKRQGHCQDRKWEIGLKSICVCVVVVVGVVRGLPLVYKPWSVSFFSNQGPEKVSDKGPAVIHLAKHTLPCAEIRKDLGLSPPLSIHREHIS